MYFGRMNRAEEVGGQSRAFESPSFSRVEYPLIQDLARRGQVGWLVAGSVLMVQTLNNRRDSESNLNEKKNRSLRMVVG